MMTTGNKKEFKKEEINTLLGQRTDFEGKLSFEGTIRIDGKFTGEIQSSGMLIVGEKAVVHADTQAGVILIYGEARGKFVARNRIEAYAPAKIFGEIHTPILVFGEGVIFQGTSHMMDEMQGLEEKKGASTEATSGRS